ncbi:MAG: mannose-1-phosphate guanylyltransferase/mannose-6-phosphate isomerase, partial [Gammaproteobacteria bacterium]|nr:mannose-1-phosphate guanylyltransferase/mannose-6-phosphate isomerase [Gammaproteobacteria bacterium]
MKEHLFGLLIAGGAGTRLWPLSRASHPKQLLPLSGSGQSLLQDAFRRLVRSMDAAHIHTVTSQAYAGTVLQQLQAVAADYPRANVLAEPMGRDSAAAVLWGTLRVQHLDPEAIVVIVWSDQLIREEDAFDAALAKACEVARQERLVAVGVPAIRPATTLGYIKYGRRLDEGVYAAERFIEKPDLQTAKRFVADGTYLWNPGVFVFKVRTLLAEFARHAPTMMGHFREDGAASGSNDWCDASLIAEIYAKLPRESIDYLVLEKTDRLALVPADLDWSDLGTWDELYFQAPKDENGNAVRGDAVTYETRNTFIHGGKRLVATVGVEDLVVIDTDDALLVCNMSRVRDVKLLVEHLKEQSRPEADTPVTTNRPWGSFTVLHEGPRHKVKVLEVLPHKRLSLQAHEHRAEHWVVAQGHARLTIGEQEADYAPNEYLYIPQGARHR